MCNVTWRDNPQPEEHSRAEHVRVALDGNGCGNAGCRCSPPFHICAWNSRQFVMVELTMQEAMKIRMEGRLVHKNDPDEPKPPQLRAALHYLLGLAPEGDQPPLEEIAAPLPDSPESREQRARAILADALARGLFLPGAGNRED